MKKLTLWLCHFFVPDHENVSSVRVRTRYGLLSGWVSIFVNLVLFAAKLALGLLSGSISLLADAFHTLTDAVTSIIVVFSFQISSRPSDAKHPYGHGRAEHIGALVLAALLIVIGVEFFRSSLRKMMNPGELDVTYITVAVVIITIVVKELLGRFTDVIAKLIDSDALRADSWHHRTDAISSLFVLVAIVGAIFGRHWLDGVMGIAVAAFLAVLGVKVFKDAADRLLGDRPSDEMISEIFSMAASVDGVLNVHDISVHMYGVTKMFSLHAQVAHTVSTIQAHEIAEKIQNTIDAHFEAAHTVVHIDPVDVSSEAVGSVVEEIKSFSRTRTEIVSFHDVRITEDAGKKVIDLDLAIQKGTPDDVVLKLKSDLSARLGRKFPQYAARIEVDPDFFYQKPE